MRNCSMERAAVRFFALCFAGCATGSESVREGMGGDSGAPDVLNDAAATLPDDAGTATLGEPCAGPRDCASGICVEVAAGRSVCSRPCDESATCPAGWTCAEHGGGEFVELTCLCEEHEETCNEVDDDCDGSVDEELADCCAARETRDCGLAAGACDTGTETCLGGGVWGACEGASLPTLEVCDGVDNDCDGSVDEDVTATYYPDADGDSFGASTGSVGACSAPVGYVVDDEDCDDSRAMVHPGAAELCNGIDDDCNASTAEGSGEPTLGQACDGADGDLCNEGMITCTAGALGCDDATGTNTEACNGLDDDCDGTVDEGATTTYYRDADGDTYGSVASGTMQACSRPAGYSSNNTDCNDASAAIYPGATETVADGIDESCDDSEICYVNIDNDGYRANAMVATNDIACTASGHALATRPPGDCNDNNAAIYPGATERCNGIDDDCNPSTADGSGEPTLGQECDGPDADTCRAGATGCVLGVLSCSADNEYYACDRGCFAIGTGTLDDPFVIDTNGRLDRMRFCYDSHFALGTDLDLAGACPLTTTDRTYANGLTGSFDGRGHTIANLSCQLTVATVGLLPWVGLGASVRNLRITDAHMGGTSYVGLVAGINMGLIQDISVSGMVSGTVHVGGVVGSSRGGSVDRCQSSAAINGGSWVGGVVGRVSSWAGTRGLLTHCTATGSITGTAAVVGGVAGSVDGSDVVDCSFDGTVNGSNWEVGGIAGAMSLNGSIRRSWSSGTVHAAGNAVGGVVGILVSGLVSESHSSSAVSGAGQTGGLAGHVYSAGAVSDAYFDGSVVATGSSAGGAVGWAEGPLARVWVSAVVTGSDHQGAVIGVANPDVAIAVFYDSSRNTLPAVGDGAAFATPLLPAEMRYAGSYGGALDFATVWTINEGVDFPRLAWE